MNIEQVKRALTVCARAKVTPLLIGAHGVGKSAAVKQWAEENGYDLVDQRLGEMADPGDLLGIPFDKKVNGHRVTEYAVPDWVPSVTDTRPKVLFLDEISRSDKTLKNSVFKLILDREIGQYKLPESTVIVAAMNPATDDYSGSIDFRDAAYSDRFLHIVVKPTMEGWQEYAKAAGLPEVVRRFADKHVEVVLGTPLDYPLDYVKGTGRSTEFLARIVSQVPDKDILPELVTGLIGPVQGAAFLRELQEEVEIITPDQVLDDYKKVRKTVRGYIGKLDDRISMISDGILERLKDRAGKMKEGEQFATDFQKNLERYIADLNQEQIAAFYKKLWQDPETTEHLEYLNTDPALVRAKLDKAGLPQMRDEIKPIMEEAEKAKQKLIEEGKISA